MRRLFASFLILICFVTGVSTVTIAADVDQEPPHPSVIPKTISLLTTTSVYAEPDEASKLAAELAPQQVQVIQPQYEPERQLIPIGETWLLIQSSWLGKVWIKLNNDRIGVIKAFETDLHLATETPLYNLPIPSASSGVSLAPQTVKTKAEFVTPSGLYAIQIETSWMGDQWLLSPELEFNQTEVLNFPAAISPDYGDAMLIRDLQVVNLGGRKFIYGRLVVEEIAWKIGRIDYGTREYPVSGTLSFLNDTSAIVAQVPYAIHAIAGQRISKPLLLPIEDNFDKSQIMLAMMHNATPYYWGLPVPPSLNITDPEGKVLLGIQRVKRTGGYTVGRAWISGKLPGTHEYLLTLSFYSQANEWLGSTHFRKQLLGPPRPEEAGKDGSGALMQVDFAGLGDWTSFDRVTMHIDNITN